jgi:hypothetical protein
MVKSANRSEFRVKYRQSITVRNLRNKLDIGPSDGVMIVWESKTRERKPPEQVTDVHTPE